MMIKFRKTPEGVKLKFFFKNDLRQNKLQLKE
jgi:hypothetical protein